MSTSPRVRARPSIDVTSAGSTMPGNSVTMSIRMFRAPLLQVQQPVGRPDHDSPAVEIHIANDLGHRRDQMLARAVTDHPKILCRSRLHSQDATDLPTVLPAPFTPLALPRA